VEYGKGDAWGGFWEDCIHGCHKGVWSRKRVSLGVWGSVHVRRGCGKGKMESWGAWGESPSLGCEIGKGYHRVCGTEWLSIGCVK
jgi:hypothetical protein